MDSGEGVAKAWEHIEFESMQDCKDQVGWTLMRDELIALCIGLLVQAHFALVLFSHYKNSELTMSRGGCLPDNDIQLGSVRRQAAAV